MLSKIAAVVLVALAGIPASLIGDVIVSLGRQLLAGQRQALLTTGGVLAGGVIYRLVCRYSSDFWSTAHHELAHAFMATLVGGKPTRLLVDGASGRINWSVPRGPLSSGRSFLVLIAPYCFSPISVALALLLSVVPIRSDSFLVVTSICAGIGLAAPLLELHPGQRDLRQAGLVASVACSLWLWTSTATVLLAELAGHTGPSAVTQAYARVGASAARFLMSL